MTNNKRSLAAAADDPDQENMPQSLSPPLKSRKVENAKLVQTTLFSTSSNSKPDSATRPEGKRNANAPTTPLAAPDHRALFEDAPDDVTEVPAEAHQTAESNKRIEIGNENQTEVKDPRAEATDREGITGTASEDTKCAKEEDYPAVKLEKTRTDEGHEGKKELAEPSIKVEAAVASGSGSDDLASTNFNPALCSPDNWAAFVLKGNEKVYNTKQILFEPIADAWHQVEQIKHSGTGSKKKAILILTNLYRLILYHCPHELIYAVFLSLHKVAPEYFGIEIGIGESLLIRTICETYGRKEAMVKADLQETGDLGSIAQASKLSTKTLFAPQRLSLKVVYEELRSIAEAKGNNAQQRKREKVKKLLVAAVKQEPKFIVRFLEKNLRIGVKSAAVLAALASAFILSPVIKDASRKPPNSIKSAILASDVSSDFIAFFSQTKVKADCRENLSKSKLTNFESQLQESFVEMEQAVRQAYSQVPNLPYLIFHLLCGADASSLKDECVICPGIPVSPMLAKPTKGLGEVLEAMSGVRFRAEFKYDGERIQIHKLEDGQVHLFSRNMEVLDIKYPDVKEVAAEAVNESCKDFILDAEVVAFNKQTKEILPFQTLAGRKRKDVDVKTLDIHVCLFVFDCLRVNDESLVSVPLETRQEKMKEAVHEIPERLHYARGGTVVDTTELEALLQEAIDNRTEGLMVKVLEGERSYYEPSKRSVNWLKLKKDYLDHLGDSVDLVPIGAFYGRGRRSGAYGAYLLAVYDPDEEIYRSVCKVATGFSDEDLSTHYNKFKEKLLTTKPENYHVSEKMYPEVWLEACEVWEVKAADLSISPVHTAGWGRRANEKGIALRFPRYLRPRQDKKPQQATDGEQIISMYDAQFAKQQKETEEIEEAEDEDLLI